MLKGNCGFQQFPIISDDFHSADWLPAELHPARCALFAEEPYFVEEPNIVVELYIGIELYIVEELYIGVEL